MLSTIIAQWICKVAAENPLASMDFVPDMPAQKAFSKEQQAYQHDPTYDEDARMYREMSPETNPSSEAKLYFARRPQTAPKAISKKFEDLLNRSAMDFVPDDRG